MPVESDPVTAGPVISVESLWSRVGDSDRTSGPSWQPVPELAELADGEVTQLMAGPVAIVGCRLGTNLYAFRDRCGQCEAALTGATLGRLLGGAIGDAALRCASCGAHFQVRRAGACLERPELHLNPLPLLVDQGVASVAVPVSVAA